MSTKDMLCKPGAVQVPPNTQVDSLYEKLDYLSTGEVWKPDEEKLNSSKHFLDLAKEKSEAFTKASKRGSFTKAKNQEEGVTKDQQEAMPATIAAN